MNAVIFLYIFRSGSSGFDLFHVQKNKAALDHRYIKRAKKRNKNEKLIASLSTYLRCRHYYCGGGCDRLSCWKIFHMEEVIVVAHNHVSVDDQEKKQTTYTGKLIILSIRSYPLIAV